MIQTTEATFDGRVLLPDAELSLSPNTRVRLTIEVVNGSAEAIAPSSFLHTARSLKLEGPADWAENLEHHLYEQDDSAHE